MKSPFLSSHLFPNCHAFVYLYHRMALWMNYILLVVDVLLFIWTVYEISLLDKIATETTHFGSDTCTVLKRGTLFG